MSKRVGLPVTILITALIATAFASGPVVAGEDVVTTQELVGDMAQYDGRTVTIEGEAIGDVMLRGDYAWITVNDDAYSMPQAGDPGSGRSLEDGGTFAGYANWGMGVWVTREQAENISFCGGYKGRGDTVRVTGVFHRACPEHGGDTDIHATTLLTLEKGYPFSHRFDYAKLMVVLSLLAICLAMWFLMRRKIRAAIHQG
jgi:hypothetical protein